MMLLLWQHCFLLLILVGLSDGSLLSFAFTSSFIPSTRTTTSTATINTRTRTAEATSSSSTLLWAAASKKSKATPSIASLQQWAAETAGIKTSPTIQLKDDKSGSGGGGGRGWFTTASSSSSSSMIQPGALLLTVPANVALTVECPGLGPDDASIRRMLGDNGRQVLKQLPWFVQMALYLYKLDQVDSFKNDDKKLDGSIPCHEDPTFIHRFIGLKTSVVY